MVLFLTFWILSGNLPDRCDEAEEFAAIVEQLALKPGQEVADVGAGGGTWTRKLARYVGSQGKVYGTDVKPHFLEGVRVIARQRGFSHVEPVLGTEQDTGLKPASCDAILLRLVYHAFDDPKAMEKSLFSALRPGGRILIIGFRPKLPELERAMTRSGFKAGWSTPNWCGHKEVYAQVFVKP